jgi:predicted NBD/HSP70 family sugar kinase
VDERPSAATDAGAWAAIPPQQYSRHRLLEALRHSGGSATRAELSRITGLSRATVSNAIGRLIVDGLVAEVVSEPVSGAASSRGRPAVLVRLRAPSGVVIGLDFGHSHLRAAVADLAGQVLAEVHHALLVDNSPDDAMAAAADEFFQLLDSIEATATDVSGVVMGLPSPIERGSGRIVSNNILPGWVNRTPAAELQQLIQLPVILDNDANLAALGEMTYGGATGIRNLIYVKASTGIGTGLIFDGRLYRGNSGTAGELGHVQINPDGAVCRCGNRGCLETLVSIPHVLANLQPMHHQPLTIADVLGLVETGDVSARRVITDAGRVIGRALADLCNVLNPGAVVVGGELSAAGEPFTAGIREAIERRTQPVVADAVSVRTSALADRAEVLGAIALALQAGPARR